MLEISNRFLRNNTDIKTGSLPCYACSKESGALAMHPLHWFYESKSKAQNKYRSNSNRFRGGYSNTCQRKTQEKNARFYDALPPGVRQQQARDRSINRRIARDKQATDLFNLINRLTNHIEEMQGKPRNYVVCFARKYYPRMCSSKGIK